MGTRRGPQRVAGTARRSRALGGRAATTTAAPPPGSTRTGRARNGSAASPPAWVWGTAGSGSCAQPSIYLRQRREGAVFSWPDSRGLNAADAVTAPVTPGLLLVTVGTDHHPFDRLVRWAAAWLAAHPGQLRCL